VRRVEILTSRLVQDVFAGQYHAAFKGRGVEFEEVREYQPGDDIRSIDWNVTARAGRPFVKVFQEERELTVVLLVDVSASQDFGSDAEAKSDLVARLGATFAFSAITNNDKVSLVLFSDRIEKFVPARKGRQHVLRVIRELLVHERESGQTRVSVALEHLNHVFRRRAVVFIISDFRSPDFSGSLRVATRRHDLIPVLVRDPRERALPPVGIVQLRDAETGETVLIPTGSRAFRREFARHAAEVDKNLKDQMRRLNVDTIEVETNADPLAFVSPLRKFFRKRGKRR
jgi:uncharacterized protein (DUF58 family)